LDADSRDKSSGKAPVVSAVESSCLVVLGDEVNLASVAALSREVSLAWVSEKGKVAFHHLSL
jgi:hypothetical protein